jgi:hypothetical protein
LRFSIADCRLPIGFYRQTPIRNRQLTIGNQETHPLPRGGTDLIARNNSPSHFGFLLSNTLTEHYQNFFFAPQNTPPGLRGQIFRLSQSISEAVEMPQTTSKALAKSSLASPHAVTKRSLAVSINKGRLFCT